ncbi:MAG: LysR family transcriptional regulator [Rhodobacteraceae bacterium]|nr:LysR family transcriptional regulator [Paracoccaceae bacterium]
MRMSRPALPLSAVEVRAISALAEHRRTAPAAESLHLSQSALSRHVRAAEERLGVPLFQRGWSGTDATGAGEAVVRQCHRILDRLARVDAALGPSRLATHARWRHLRAVAACVQSGGASGAARLLGVRQPAISQALRDVAGYAGQALFSRRRDGLSPTPAGRQLATVWDAIARDLSEVPQLLDPVPGALSGRVAVGMLPFSGQNLVVESFAELTVDHPNLRLIAIPGSYQMLCQALQRGEIDLIMGSLRAPAPPGFVEERLYDEEFTMIARADHPCHSGPMTLETLARLNWSVAPHGTPVRRYFEALFREAPEPPHTQSCEIFSFANAEQIILGSQSVAMLCYSAERLSALHPGLRRLEVALPEPSVAVGLTRVEHAPSTPAVEVFVERLRGRVAALGLN